MSNIMGHMVHKQQYLKLQSDYICNQSNMDKLWKKMKLNCAGYIKTVKFNHT